MNKDQIEELQKKKQEVLKMGGAEEISRQHEQGKLTVRERLNLLYDPGSFQELGILGTYQSNDPAMKGKPTPADGIITGYGSIQGRKAFVIAYDFTVIAGTIG